MRSARPVGTPKGTYLKSGQELMVPGILPAPIVEKSIPVARDFEVRADLPDWSDGGQRPGTEDHSAVA